MFSADTQSTCCRVVNRPTLPFPQPTAPALHTHAHTRAHVCRYVVATNTLVDLPAVAQAAADGMIWAPFTFACEHDAPHLEVESESDAMVNPKPAVQIASCSKGNRALLDAMVVSAAEVVGAAIAQVGHAP